MSRAGLLRSLSRHFSWLRRSLGNGTMLVLTLSTAALLVGLEWRRRHAPHAAGLRGLGWLRAQGRLSYEIYLTHMFVVYSLVAAFKAAGGEVRDGWMCFVPAVLGCWALGAVVERAVTRPAGRWTLQRWMPKPESVHAAQGDVAGR